MKTAIVTGASGFLGTYLCCHLLQNNYRVIALHRSDSEGLLPKIARQKGISTGNLEWRSYSLFDPLMLENCFREADVVFHCAAVVSFKKGQEAELMETNVTGTRNVVNACIKAGVDVLVHCSSVAAMGRPGKHNLVTEESDWVESKYNTPYAVSKHLSELEVWRGMEEGLNVCIINPGIILGPGDGHSGSNQIFSHVIKGVPFYPIGLNAFVGVDDVAEMMRLLAEKRIFGKRFLSVAENLPYKTILDHAAAALGKKGPRWALRGLLLSVAIGFAKMAEFLHLPFPFPSSGLRSTSVDTEYKTLHHDLDPYFKYTAIGEVIRESAKNI